MSIQQQVHDRFKVFVGDSVEALNAQVTAFTAGATVAAKSIGVEYLESKGSLVLSLGYCDDAEGYAARLSAKSVGVHDLGSPESLAALESALSDAASAAGDVICHELYVTETDEVHAVFLEKV